MKAICVVLDTNVLVSALLSPSGNPAKIYHRFLAETLTLAMSEGIFAEYREVLSRPRFGISPDDLDKVLTVLWQNGKKIEPIRSTIPLPDEDDRVFYDTAVSATACLVTGNARHYPRETFIFSPAGFLERYPH